MKRDNFYLYWGISFLIIIVIAFAPKYWIPVLSGDFDLIPNVYIHWHAFFATAWVFIYLVQVFLIKNQNPKLHQRLGYSSVVFAFGVLISGFYVSLGLVERALLVNSAGAKPLLLVNLLDLLLFGILYIMGLKKRKVALEHKRLVTLSAIVLLNAALFRIGRFIIGPGFLAVLLAIVLTATMIILFVWLEKRHSQKPNKQLWRITIAIILIHIVRIPLAITPQWATITDFILDKF